MPSIFSHPAVPVAAALILGPKAVPGRLLLAGAAACILPDLDVAAFHLGIPYAHAFGHRGFSHSLAFAAAVGLAAAWAHRMLGAGMLRVFLFVSFAAASHGILDAFTNGGLGIAFLWPYSSERFFAPFRPIAVSPIGTGFFSARGMDVMRSEMLWVWLPCASLAVIAAILRRAGRFVFGRKRT